MDIYDILKALIFLTLAITGITGNGFIILSFCETVCQKQHKKLKTTDIIIVQLATSNFIMVLSRGVPDCLFAFGIKNLFNDTGCKFIAFISRVARSMSMCLTSLLSCFQFVTLASSNAKWAYIKNKIQTFLLTIVISLLFANTLAYVTGTIFSVSGSNSTDLRYSYNFGYCLVTFPSKESFQAKGFLTFAQDCFVVVLMAMTSGSMLFILYWHGKQVKGIRTSDQSQEVTAENRAAKAVAILVSLYIFFFGVDSTIMLYQVTFFRIHIIVSDIRTFFSVCYTSVFPFLIIKQRKSRKIEPNM
ncbi:olfactory receptor class A-like protein 1 [Protopterus annectens]|uniref:olfactory receptor class A-like protein 1 n=1 Tax=Protopterus annectens TaxID=7888 RepID=UPI001CFB01B2|nr:olfactory receptor class A-like protein 1 [Protopterus annectens]